MKNNLDFNFQVLIDAIGLVQGVTLGVLLIILNRRRYRSSFFLGLFLVFYSLQLIIFIFDNPNSLLFNPNLFLLPFNFSWLIFPLFFLYTQQVSILSNENTKYWLLYPGILAFSIQIIIFFLPYDTKQVIAKSELFSLLFWKLADYYSWIIGIWNLRLLYKHRIEVNNTYSFIAFKELQWARIFLIYLLSISIISHILTYGYAILFHYKVYLAALDLIAIYWLSYFGIVQRNVLSVTTNTSPPDDFQNKPIDQKHSSLIEPKRLEELMVKIDDHMILTESFINPELTIMDLAEAKNEHPKLVSTVINTIANKNFNSYVNKFRIEKAKTLLSKEKMENLSIEGIGNEVGFHSKSAFYSAFKKETGTTPTKFIELSERT